MIQVSLSFNAKDLAGIPEVLPPGELLLLRALNRPVLDVFTFLLLFKCPLYGLNVVKFLVVEVIGD